MQNSHHGLGSRPLLFGELLFDQLPDGRKVLGGAPFNVAWHLQGLGLQPLLITRVGNDAAGEEAVAAMETWGLDTRGVQRDCDYPTGAVEVLLDGTAPCFRILADQAYDHIDDELALATIAGESYLMLYHGTLAARGESSRRALEALRAHKLPVFVDANLRSPWWDPALLRKLLHGTRWLKLSREELDLVEVASAGNEDVVLRAETLRSRYGLDLLILTEGEAGARIFTPFGRSAQPAIAAKPLVDTVGAGDAFAAVCILGLARGWPLAETLTRAAELAARICSRSGATHADRGLYQELLERWVP